VAQDPNTHDDLAGLYRAAIRQHAAAPVGYRQPIAATHRHEEYNPLCGDRVELQLQVSGAQIEAAAFDGEGCAICMASASLLCSLAPGRTIEALLQLGQDLHHALDIPAGAAVGAASAAITGTPVGAASAAITGTPVGGASAAMGAEKDTGGSRLKPLLQPLPQQEIDGAGLPEAMRALLGVRPYPSRVRCATLPWTAAERALSG